MMPSESSNPKVDRILGIGLDNEDGHTRLTTGEDFLLYGGSQETHKAMQETMLEITNRLQARGLDLANIQLNDLIEVAGELGLTEDV